MIYTVTLNPTYGVNRVIVSMGSDGLLFADGAQCLYAKGLQVPVRSTVGAGDSVVAALSYAEETGMCTTETVRLAAAAGSACVMCSGTQAAEYETIAELMQKVEMIKVR